MPLTELHAMQSSDRQAICLHAPEPFILSAELPHSSVQTRLQAPHPIPILVIKHLFHIPAFPVSSYTTERRKTAHHSSLSATSTGAFPKVFIAKSYEKLEVVAFEDGSLWDARAYKWLPLSTN